ncbi:phosphodiester glycosidase family protein [Croceicoccus naphthovorans]|uniref:Uncharacterized protein n=1 Tax=Croceicoccus naphthovorans TaxID=1348774 RepID=A0A0G3XEH6_9SPHN|nr:phosphodiester glycosidase family protein [Croceicoccus naphthovorans]AKM09965.1 hypothetical protein AB433_08220 [Croceicoccus naphthovorans]MBB3990869.1 uncharacterized protein YigE (DUF2233 family) [Croceicoccus naphthovorans]
MRLFAAAVLLLAACSDDSGKQAKGDPICKAEVFEGSRFTHCTVDPAKARIELVLNGADRKPLRSFAKLEAEAPVDTVHLAMNAGMFDDDGQPIGLLAIDGKEVHALNGNDGPGNFHMLPNGVFWGGDQTWHVDTSDHFASLEMAAPPPYATQSGPMLVIDGELHPDFAGNGASKHFRNGAGVDDQGHVHFVISDDLVSFGRFARFFRDEAKTPNALYLDGAVSALWYPEEARKDGAPPLGPLIVVHKSPKAGA